MPGLYLDTSALGCILLDEPEAPAILAELRGFDLLVSSRLLRIELRRLALRRKQLATVDQLLASVALVPLDESVLVGAETVPPANVATLDAIHLATIVRLADANLLDAAMTYDVRLAGAVREHGLTVLAPA